MNFRITAAVGLLAALMSSAASNGQTIEVFPSDHTTHEGSSYQRYYPLANGVARFQAVYSVWDLTIPNGAMITRVGFRPDKDASVTGHRIQLEILMGHTDKELSQLSYTFDNNYLSPPVTVFRQQIFQLPDLTPTSPGPSTNYVWITLDTPFQYQGGKSLIVDYLVYANDNGNARFSYPLDKAGFYSERQSFGAGCQASNGKTPVLATSGAQLGGRWQLSVSDGLPNAPALILMGRNNSNHGGISLPFSLAPLGAPGCSWLVEFVTMLDTRLGGSGTVSNYFNIPKLIELYGTPVFAQYWIADPFANNAGVVTTNGVSATLGIAPQNAYILASGNVNATSGSRRLEDGTVAVFEYR